MIKVAVVGATGYTGEELVDILVGHPSADIVSLSAKIDKPQDIAEIFPSLSGKISMVCGDLDVKEVNAKADVVFLALPHGVSMAVAPKFLKAKKRVIDLSADYRLSVSDYEKWYKRDHTDKMNLSKAVYGLPELHRDQIKKASFIANPGCYPTSIALASVPAIKEGLAETDGIIADSKSGVTGAGRRADIALSFGEVNESMKAYKINQHQHMPEIEMELGKFAKKKIKLSFIPHLVPLNRGILSTVYMQLKKAVSLKEVVATYKAFYKGERFVRVLDEGIYPTIRDVVGSNFCGIGLVVDKERGLLIAVSVIDNLTKGAAGQAVQNMNIMCGLDETMGLM
ncbi:MAG: N-acetyl-gamma-glutamyl-phosphate reductase [Candidatus Omnitrophica bacterium]|nr:N-acetyl-gamma-glutamyl-phosphate reductase [Candidatus Omnitrophota bacterium]